MVPVRTSPAVDRLPNAKVGPPANHIVPARSICDRTVSSVPSPPFNHMTNSSSSPARWVAASRAESGRNVITPSVSSASNCPNESVALSVLRLAFDRVGLAAQPVRTTVLASQGQAQERGFVGSPTILINGVDPFRADGQSPAHACRVYATPAGLSGVPPLDDVISALTVASNREPTSPE